MQKQIPDWLIDRLPEYQKIEYIKPAFSDSTHQLWRLQGSSLDSHHQHHFLKLCSNTESPFWLIMQDLFDFELKTEIGNFSDTYSFVDEVCSLEIPELISNEMTNDGSYILTSELAGDSLDSKVNDEMVRQLANHLAELHSISNHHCGALSNPHLDSSEWPERLITTLRKSAKKWGGVFLQSKKFLKQALIECKQMDATTFVPMMPDLRWDQFLQSDNRLTALIDLDAFVYAPRELDFVILEYLLTEDQIDTFKAVYTEHREIPDLNEVRIAYRLLLFYMQVLGENDLERWMNKQSLF